MRLDILSGLLPSLSCVFFLHYSDEVRQIQTLTILRRRCKFGFMPQSTHNAPLFATFLWRLCEDERSIAIYSSVVPETFKTHLGFGRGVDARAMFHAMKKRSLESLTASGPKYVSLSVTFAPVKVPLVDGSIAVGQLSVSMEITCLPSAVI